MPITNTLKLVIDKVSSERLEQNVCDCEYITATDMSK